MKPTKENCAATTRSVRMNAYLALEKAMFQLDNEDDSLADTVRDALDPIWRALSKEEQAALNSRGVIDEATAGSVG